MSTANFTALHYLAESAEWQSDCYYPYDLMSELLQTWAREHPNLMKLGSAGKSGQGRELWVATITNFATGPDNEKPAYYVDANIHAAEVTGSAVALATIERLLTGFGIDSEITRLLNDTAIYIIPRIAVDGAERFLLSPEDMRSSIRHYPGLAAPGALQPSDLNGDGLISYMRVEDSGGPWKVSPLDSRIMTKREPHEYGGIYYFVYPEGDLTNWDGGAISIDPGTRNLDFNRNFPHFWKPEWEQRGSGPFPLSEPETRAIAEFVMAHPNIHGSQHYHTMGGAILRCSAIYPDSDMHPLDLRAYTTLGQIGEELTGYFCMSIFHENPITREKPGYGIFFDWMFDQVGVFAFATELWGLAKASGWDFKDFIDLLFRRTEAQDLAMLQLFDEQTDGRGFTNWELFEHPQLGKVEIGGWDRKFGQLNPPGPLLPEELERNIPFTIAAMGSSPLLRIIESGIEQISDGLYRVSIIVGNDGFLPSYGSEVYRASGRAKPVTARLELPEGVTLVSDPAQQTRALGHLAGRLGQHTSFIQTADYPNLSRARAEWTVLAKPGQHLEIIVSSERAGTKRVTIVIP